MPNLSFSVGSLNITPLFWGGFLSIVLSLFSIWKALKEDYKEEEIFTLNIIVIIFSLIVSRVLFVIFNFSVLSLSVVNWFKFDQGNNFSITGAFLGATAATCFWGKRKNKNFWEILDSYSLPLLFFVLIGGLALFLKTGQILSLVLFVFGVLGIFINSSLKKRYRSFSWYKSGKIGFLFCVISSYAFITLLFLALLKKVNLYWEEFSWAVSIVFLLGALYYRSGRDLKQDLRIVKKKA